MKSKPSHSRSSIDFQNRKIENLGVRFGAHFVSLLFLFRPPLLPAVLGKGLGRDKKKEQEDQTYRLILVHTYSHKLTATLPIQLGQACSQ